MDYNTASPISLCLAVKNSILDRTAISQSAKLLQHIYVQIKKYEVELVSLTCQIISNYNLVSLYKDGM